MRSGNDRSVRVQLVLQTLLGLAVAAAVVGFTYRHSAVFLPLTVVFVALAVAFITVTLVTGVDLRGRTSRDRAAQSGGVRPASRTKRAVNIAVVGLFAALLIGADAFSSGGLNAGDVVLATGAVTLVTVIVLFGGSNKP